MKKIVLSVACIASLVLADVKVFRDGETPSVDELKTLLGTSGDAMESASGSRLGKSKGLSIGGDKSVAKEERAASKSQSPKESAKEVSLPIKFANNSYEIQNDQNNMQTLNNLQQALQNAKVTLIIEGHTNAVGSSKHNTILSKKRAEAVKQYLVENGINSAMLVSVGKGFERPLEGYDPKDPNNRRVQFKVMN
ncbi:MAG TPA: OmpA family protein [Campylobacterales bacterium]|nr:OmpA family protein [Campylobacterales bacterium]